MKKNKLLAMICVIVLIAGILLVGCTGEVAPPPAQQEEEEEEEEEAVYHLEMGVIGPLEAAMNQVVHIGWLDSLVEESGGRIDYTFYPSSQAAAPDRFYDETLAGTIDIGNQLLSFAPGRFPGLEVTQLPLIFQYPGSHQAGRTMMALYEKYPQIQAEWGDVKFLYAHAAGLSQVHNNVRQVKTLEDLEGLILNGSGKYITPTIEALGAIPESLGAGGETYDGLAKGVIDGVTIEWEGIVIWGYIDVLKYSTDIGGISITPFISVMNLDTYNSMPPDLQELFDWEHMLDVTDAHGHEFDKDNQHFRDVMQENYEAQGLPDIYVLTDEERARWVDAVAPIRQTWVDEVNALGYPGQAILDDAIMFAEQYKYDGPCEPCIDILERWGAMGYE